MADAEAGRFVDLDALSAAWRRLSVAGNRLRQIRLSLATGPTAISREASAVSASRLSCAVSVCSLFEKTMRINNRLSGFSSSQTIEQFHQARLVRITHGRFAIRLHPFRVLHPKVVVNLLPELCVSVDLMMQGRWLGERFMCSAGWFV
jgi:hypothetical protein